MITNIFNENICTALDEWHGQSYPLVVKQEKARRGWFGMEWIIHMIWYVFNKTVQNLINY